MLVVNLSKFQRWLFASDSWPLCLLTLLRPMRRQVVDIVTPIDNN
jgi:hypothetical protein